MFVSVIFCCFKIFKKVLPTLIFRNPILPWTVKGVRSYDKLLAINSFSFNEQKLGRKLKNYKKTF